MAINISISEPDLILAPNGSDLAPRHESQLSFWGFHYDSSINAFICESENPTELLIKLRPLDT